ncbi:hypothetical protein ACRRTK_022341 [Alexandromys fortis]
MRGYWWKCSPGVLETPAPWKITKNSSSSEWSSRSLEEELCELQRAELEKRP